MGSYLAKKGRRPAAHYCRLGWFDHFHPVFDLRQVERIDIAGVYHNLGRVNACRILWVTHRVIFQMMEHQVRHMVQVLEGDLVRGGSLVEVVDDCEAVGASLTLYYNLRQFSSWKVEGY